MSIYLAPGTVLTAAHNLLDSNFKRSVVFLAEHGDTGTLGYILNRRLEQTLRDILPDVRGGFNAPLYWGGPCQNDTLHCLHRLGTHIPGALEVADGIFWGGTFEVLTDLLVAGGASLDDVRFFVGYAGWSNGQLEHEIKESSWMLTHATPNLIFEETDKNLWTRVVSSMGGDFRIIAGTPEHPSLN
jgi:putative transcriptional regulator